MSWREAALDRYYNASQGWVDGTTEFHAMCRDAIPEHAAILEVGPGPTNRTSKALAMLGVVTGLDVDPAALGNEYLHRAKVYDGARFPFADGEFEACVSNYVLEHVANVREHFDEVRRVLKPGSPWLIRTPNRFHYVAMIASLTPQWIHLLLANRLRGLRNAHDPYPTVYAVNTRHALAAAAKASGFVVESLRMIEKEPTYGMASRVLFYPFMAYERMVNATERLAPLRANILGLFRRR